MKICEKNLEKISNFKRENYLEIDLENYHDESSINNLIGSNKGYIGYESGGILSEHIIKHPFSLIYFKCFDEAIFSIQNFIKKLSTSNYFLDNKGRKIVINNCILVIESKDKSRNLVGITKQTVKNSSFIQYDICI